MKLITQLLLVVALISTNTFLGAQDGLTKTERKKAVTSLKATAKSLKAATKGLSETQLNFKPSADSWSIAECVEHLAASEKAFWGMAQQSLKAGPDPSKKSEVKMNDEQILGIIVNRTNKVKTQAPLEPKNGFGSYSASTEAFKTQRKANAKYLKKTSDDLRNHYFDFPFGKVDTYQLMLFMSGHTTRHTAQIEEIKASASFPKS